jgi:hypothetical protein
MKLIFCIVQTWVVYSLTLLFGIHEFQIYKATEFSEAFFPQTDFSSDRRTFGKSDTWTTWCDNSCKGCVHSRTDKWESIAASDCKLDIARQIRVLLLKHFRSFSLQNCLWQLVGKKTEVVCETLTVLNLSCFAS